MSSRFQKKLNNLRDRELMRDRIWQSIKNEKDRFLVYIV